MMGECHKEKWVEPFFLEVEDDFKSMKIITDKTIYEVLSFQE
jgi:hypothetical protein